MAQPDSTDATARRPVLWASGAVYEPYVGRWSRLVAREFVAWLAVPPDRHWLDVGCGTGALSQAVLDQAAPAAVLGIDRSAGFVAHAQAAIDDPRVTFQVGDAQQLPIRTGRYDAVVSGLVLNFVPQPDRMVAEMARAARPGGSVALYVWDYAGEMQLMRHFWDAAAALNPAARALDEGRRSPICQPDALDALFRATGLRDVAVRAIDVPTVFRDFDDYWTPFLAGQAPAPAYAMSLNEADRTELRDTIRARLPVQADGSILLIARAWAVRGVRDQG
jgi:SAM-dependent methyltransferase